MFGFFKKKKKESSPEFTIEFYPLTGVYFAKRGRDYLRIRSGTGIVELVDDYLFSIADQFKDEAGARHIIELYKEQIQKQNVKTIKY